MLPVVRSDERAALGREHRLAGLGVPELPAALRVAAGLEHPPVHEDAVEAVRVRGQRADEGRNHAARP
jgi:hypothetical protein